MCTPVCACVHEYIHVCCMHACAVHTHTPTHPPSVKSKPSWGTRLSKNFSVIPAWEEYLMYCRAQQWPLIYPGHVCNTCGFCGVPVSEFIEPCI